MKLLAAILFTFFSAISQAESLIRVVVLDSGIKQDTQGLQLCKTGHRDFTGNGSITDSGPKYHGTNVAGLITKHAGPSGYCIIIVKIFEQGSDFNEKQYYRALNYVISLKSNIINLSFTGKTKLPYETQLIRKLLDSGTVIVASAGNQGLDLNKVGCIVWPACADRRIFVIGNSESNDSNIGSVVDEYIDGNYAFGGGITMSGTSQAAAIFTGKAVAKALVIAEKEKESENENK